MNDSIHEKKLQGEIKSILQKAVVQEELQKRNIGSRVMIQRSSGGATSKATNSKYNQLNDSILAMKSIEEHKSKYDDKRSGIQSRSSHRGLVRSLNASRISRTPNFILGNVREETYNNSLASQSLKGTAAVPIQKEQLVAYSKAKMESSYITSRRRSADVADGLNIKSNAVDMPFSDESSD